MATHASDRRRRNAPIRVILGAGENELPSALEPYPHVDVVGVGQDGVDVVRLNQMLQPDVVVMDLRLPVMDGIRAIRCMIEARLPAKILVIGHEEDACLAPIALEAGADGFLSSKALPADIVSKVRALITLPERTYSDPWARLP